MNPCLIDESVTTSLLSYPISAGWISPPDGLELVPRLTAETVAERNACALVGSVDAALLMDRYAVVSDLAFVSHHAGAIALWTPVRPDEVEQATIALDGVSRTAEAVARATIKHFYGIDVANWDRSSSTGDGAVLEDADALRPAETGHLGDLARAWFILSGFPLPTHLLVVPRDLADREPDAVRDVVDALKAALAAGTERRRELRRNLADALNLDRERLAAVQADQTTVLSKTGRKAWLDLIRRTSRAMKIPVVTEPAVVTVYPDE